MLGLSVTVLDEHRLKLDRQAVVKVHDEIKDSNTWQTTSDDSQITFCGVELGKYEIEASAVGYLTETKTLQITPTIQTPQIEIILHKDPSAVELGDADNTLPSSARKDTRRAVLALKSANYKEAQKRLEKVYKIAPSSAQINFLYGYLFVQLNNFERAEEFLVRAAKLDPRRVQTLCLLGRVQLQRNESTEAEKTLEQAVGDDSSYWVAHNLLADAYLRSKEYEKAREQAQLAINQGQAAGSVAQFVLGQALADLGHEQEAIEALNKFLQTNASNSAAPEVRTLIAKLAKRDSGAAAASEMPVTSDLGLAASALFLPESSWGPPGVDDVKPPVASGVPCPYQQILDATGERAKQLVSNIAQFAAVESIVHQQLDKAGVPISKETRKFNYVAWIREDRPGFLETGEYRDLRHGLADLPDSIATTGFVSLALIFHPDMRENFEVTCEGLGDWHGQAAWVMHFRQREDRPSRFADYVVAGRGYPMKLRGRAWITADNLQIVRIESDLVNPLPRLAVCHQIAEYGPVHFNKNNVDLWLPQHVDIYLDMNRHYYHRQHSFDHYMLFAVDSEDKGPLKNARGKSTTQTP